MLEAFGFASGALCVWLVVRQSIWNWPVGIASNLVYIVVFLEARLFADSGLQVAYVVLGVAGWWAWLHGREGARTRPVTRVGRADALGLAVATVAVTAGMTAYLRSVGDSAPFLDALTTALSLAATYLQVKKVLESWLLWIAADLVYIPLYVWKQLPL